MKVDYNKRHIETERKFYKKMNKKRSFLLSLLIVGIGYIFLCYRCWSIGISGAIEELIWMLFVVILFVGLTFAAYFLLEYERKKWTVK
jgi:hypothetical protein